jgi:hypothetical protein
MTQLPISTAFKQGYVSTHKKAIQGILGLLDDKTIA